MNQPEFELIRFANRNGTTSWRVTGWLHGLRIRKNFQTREEAQRKNPPWKSKPLKLKTGCERSHRL
jgi:hypothetical protein